MAKEAFELDPEMVLLKEKLSKIPRENWVALFSVFSKYDDFKRWVKEEKISDEEYEAFLALDDFESMLREINFWKNHLNDSAKADNLLRLMQIVAESWNAVDHKAQRTELADNLNNWNPVLVEELIIPAGKNWS